MRKGERLFESIGALLLARTKQTVGGCIEYTGSRNWDGYGVFTFGGVQYKAHRASYEETIGHIPPGMCVLHKCDNPPCVNPDHLFLGTNRDNQNDKVEKNRQAKGESNGVSRLKHSDVVYLRTSNKPFSVLLREFGLAESHLMRILNGQCWKHVIPSKSIVESRQKISQAGHNNPNYRNGLWIKRRSVSDVFAELDKTMTGEG